MKRSRTTRNATLAGIIAMGVSVAPAWAAPEWADKGETLEKCAGVVKAGKNDCGTSAHDCAGKAAKDNDPEEWAYMPSGVCEKLAGTSVKGTKEVE